MVMGRAQEIQGHEGRNHNILKLFDSQTQLYVCIPPSQTGKDQLAPFYANSKQIKGVAVVLLIRLETTHLFCVPKINK